MTRFVKNSVGGTILGLGLVGFATAGVAGYQMNINQRLAYVVKNENDSEVLLNIEEALDKNSEKAREMISVCNAKDAKDLHVFKKDANGLQVIFLCARNDEKEAIEKLLPLKQSLQTSLAQPQYMESASDTYAMFMHAENYDMRWNTYVVKTRSFKVLTFQKKEKAQEQEVQEQKVQEQKAQEQEVQEQEVYRGRNTGYHGIVVVLKPIVNRVMGFEKLLCCKKDAKQKNSS